MVVHLILLFGVRIERPGHAVPGPLRRAPAVTGAIHLIAIAPLDPAPAHSAPEDARDPDPVSGSRPGDEGDAPPATAGSGVASETKAVERLLWEPLPKPLEARRDGLTIVRDRIDADIRFYHDSLAAARDSAERIMDVSWRNGAGERWGASRNRLHFGSLTLTYCSGNNTILDCGFGASPGRLDELQDRVRRFDEIAAQGDRVRKDRTVDARAAAMRARADALRDSLRGCRH